MRVRRARLVARCRSGARSRPRRVREIGLAVGGAVERKRLADRRHRAQPLRADDLVDEDQMIVLDRRRDRRSRAIPATARIRNGRASATKSVRTEAASRRMVGPSRTRPVGDAAITSFSASSAATMRCTVERARSTRCAIWPRLRPASLALPARAGSPRRARSPGPDFFRCRWCGRSVVARSTSPNPDRTARPHLPAGSRIDTLSPISGTARTKRCARKRQRGEPWSRRSRSKSIFCARA